MVRLDEAPNRRRGPGTPVSRFGFDTVLVSIVLAAVVGLRLGLRQ